MGVTFVGVIFDAMLFGILTFQIYRFFHHNNRDRLSLKFLVCLLWILDTLQLFLICHALYYFLISHFNQPEVLQFSIWSLNVCDVICHIANIKSNLSCVV